MVKTGFEIGDIISRYIEKLKEQGISPSSVILYGSYAKGTAREYSDIDLIVVSKDFEGMNLLQRLEILGVSAARILEPVQAKGYTPEEFEAGDDLFLREVLKHGQQVAA